MNLWKTLKQTRQRILRELRTQTPAKLRRRPQLECLEDRLVPSTLITFDEMGPTNGTVIDNYYNNVGVSFSVIDLTNQPIGGTHVAAVSSSGNHSAPNVAGIYLPNA